MKKIIFVLAVIMMGFLPGVKVWADTTTVDYISASWNETDKKVDYTEVKGKECTVVENNDGEVIWNAGWYAVTANTTISGRITVSGEVHLILCDGKTLTAKEGITVSSDNTLNIYGQSLGTGALTANGNAYCAGIGGKINDEGNDNDKNAGTITINGGIVTAISGNFSAGIGGGLCGTGTEEAITISGGIVTATGGTRGAGSGGQSEGETTSTPDPTPTTKTETDPDSPAYGKEIQGNPVVVKEGDKTTTTTTYKDGTTGVRTEETTADGTKITDEVVTAKDGSTESKRIEEAADGSKVVTEAKSDSTGANTSSTTVKTDKDGKVVETIDKSKTTSDAGVITEIEKVATSDGATTTITLTQPNGNMSTVTIKKNSEGTIIETVGHARETLEDGSVQVKDSYITADTSTTETTITHPDGSSVEIDKVIDADDIKTETTFEKDKDGKVTGVTAEERDTDGNGVKKSFDVNEDGNLILTSVETTGDTLIIPDSVTDRQGRNYPITTLAKGSIPDVETVYIGENVNRIENGAFTDSGVKLIRFDGPVQKGMLEKDSLKGAGGKKGKGLTIYVQSKKDQKALKKQLKKAGAPKAKVKIAK